MMVLICIGFSWNRRKENQHGRKIFFFAFFHFVRRKSSLGCISVLKLERFLLRFGRGLSMKKVWA